MQLYVPYPEFLFFIYNIEIEKKNEQVVNPEFDNDNKKEKPS